MRHKRRRVLNLRLDALDVEVVKNYADSFLGLPVKEIVALGVPGIKARVIGRRERPVLRLVAVVREAARVLWLLSSRRYPKIYKQTERKKYLFLKLFYQSVTIGGENIDHSSSY